MVARTLLTTATAALALAAPATAASPDPATLTFTTAGADPLLAPYVMIARATFPGSPCEGREQVAWFYGDPKTDGYGWAWQDGTCRFAVNFVVPARHAMQGLLCEIVVHEIGHLDGRGHAVARTDPMYAQANLARFSGCWGRPRWAHQRIGEPKRTGNESRPPRSGVATPRTDHRAARRAGS